ncbi:MAG TPA: tRNA pseudouridine(55) synthase TruB [Gemmatimonadales bacterium]|nr:tRNA pseudouridine(55) synthase TruB [Gemmatimonadales bacterium]
MDKPAGPTSHDIVARARRMLRERAVGHTGTLDPFATGLLVLLVGRGTRVARFVEQQAKTYLATARLGYNTSTDDLTGETVGPQITQIAQMPALDQVEKAVGEIVGPQLQQPPAYSAKKVAGERSYHRARRGEAVELAPVPVTIQRIDLLDYTAPLVTFRAVVTAGTYIRAMARDLGERLGTGAHLVALRREAIGDLTLEDAIEADAISADHLLPLRTVLNHMPVVELDAADRVLVSHGRAITGAAPGTDPVLLVQGSELVAVARIEGERLHPVVVLGKP